MVNVAITSVGNPQFGSAEIYGAVSKALDTLNFNYDGVDNVVIKPNLCYYWGASTGETTDTRVVCSLIKYLREKIGENINITVAEADASAMRTKFAFVVLGYDELCRKNNVALKNLSEGNIVEKTVRVGKSQVTLPFNEVLLNADLVVNVPKLKTHNFMGVTCAMKNIFGAISKPRKYSYHNDIVNVIVAANKIVQSDIVLVDGLIARGSCPRRLGILMASNNVLTNDFVAARLMSFNPKKVPYLKLAAKEHLGPTENIDVITDGVKIEEIIANFPHYSHFLHSVSWGLQLKLLKAYTMVSGDVLPPFLEK